MPEFVSQVAAKIKSELAKVIVGQEVVMEQVLVALLAQGHILLEGVPGTAKTLMAKSLAHVLGVGFNRVQFTPDLMPSDVLGTSVFEPASGAFKLRTGPIFTEILLADEINRTPPKTQAALLEAMEERQVTIDGQRHPLPPLFLVLATQNPVEYEGTFPLPEAQLDRFLLRVNLGYPAFADELDVLERQQHAHPLEALEPVVDVEEVLALQEAPKSVYVDGLIRQYVVSLVEATRQHPDVALGASPRGSLALFRTTQALAFLRGRDYVLPDDVKDMADPVLAHRLILNASAKMKGVTASQVVSRILDAAPIPGARARGWLRD